MNSPTQTIIPSVHTTGFTLVEEDDVAFSLGLCKEIHRIYGSYQSGELEASDSVHLGLSLTMQVLSTLRGAVTRGMPAMRIEVAAAQTREMMAVMFGEPITPKTAKSTRQPLDRRCSRSIGMPAIASRKGIAADGPARSSELRKPNEIEKLRSGEAAAPPVAPTSQVPEQAESQPEASRPPEVLTLNRWRRWFRGRSVPVRILLGALGCIMAAVFVDVPIVTLLLFSNMWVQLLVAYLAIGVWGRREYGRLPAHLRPL